MASLRCCTSSSAASTALTFLKLSGTRASSTQPSPPLTAHYLLDFLLPRKSPILLRRRTLSSIAWPILASPKQVGASRRSFSTSRPQLRTVVARNSQKDDEGNDMLLEITPRAAQRLSEIMAKDSNPALALRVQVESGGCHGFQYLMSLTSAAPEAMQEDDTVFAFVSEDEDLGDAGVGDGPSRAEGSRDGYIGGPGRPKVVLDTPSLELLKGSKVDFTRELIGSQFKIVDNPLATSSCGCGTSFDIKT